MAQDGHGLISFKGRDYLLVVDYFSNYPEVYLLNNTHSSSSVIMKLKSIFSRFGIPKVVISDNGPQFSSYQFMRFAKKWDFRHDPSSPKHAKSKIWQSNESLYCPSLKPYRFGGLTEVRSR